MNQRFYTLYSDGSCNGNPGPGGYAAILRCGDRYQEIVGSAPQTTNNKMELQAVIAGLSAVTPNSIVTVYTDSGYIERAVNEGRLTVWQQNGWRRIRTGEPIQNKDVWLVLCNAIQSKQLTVKFQKIQAHKGHKLNERADFLARRAAKSVGR